jgi:hypothetical protein
VSAFLLSLLLGCIKFTILILLGLVYLVQLLPMNTFQVIQYFLSLRNQLSGCNDFWCLVAVVFMPGLYRVKGSPFFFPVDSFQVSTKIGDVDFISSELNYLCFCRAR